MESVNGPKYDENKTDYSLVPVYPLEQLAKVYMSGVRKYHKNSWREGIEYSRWYAAAMRHLLAWWDGEYFDDEDNLPHLAHAAWNLFTLLEYEANRKKYQKFDDRIKESVFDE